MGGASLKRSEQDSLWMVEVKYDNIGWFPIYNDPGCISATRKFAREAAREQVKQHEAEEVGPRRVGWDVRVREYRRVTPYRPYTNHDD